MEIDSAGKAAAVDQQEANGVGMNGSAEHASASAASGKLHFSRAALKAAKRTLRAAVADHHSCVSSIS